MMAAHRDPIELPPDDHGATGPAALARVSRVVTIEGRSGGSGNAPTVKITARRYECECRLDYLRQKGTIDHNQWKAGMIFRRYWLATREGAIQVATYGDRVQDANAVAAREAQATAIFMMDEANRLLLRDEMLVIQSVCGEDEALLWVSGVRKWNRPRLLIDGLNRLAIVWV